MTRPCFFSVPKSVLATLPSAQWQHPPFHHMFLLEVGPQRTPKLLYSSKQPWFKIANDYMQQSLKFVNQVVTTGAPHCSNLATTKRLTRQLSLSQPSRSSFLNSLSRSSSSVKNGNQQSARKGNILGGAVELTNEYNKGYQPHQLGYNPCNIL